MRKILMAAVAAAFIASPATAETKYNLTVAGYSPGGLVSTIGIGMDQALARQFPGSTLTYQTSSGGLANAMLISTGKVPIGFITDGDLTVVVEGREPFKEPITNLRLLVKPYVGAMRFQMSHVMVSKDFADSNNLKSFADIAERKPRMRLVVNRPGNNDGDVSIALLEAIGVSLDDVQKWGGQVIRAASREMTSLMLDRRADVVILGVSYAHPRIREMAQGREVVKLPISREAAEKAAKTWNGSLCEIKADEYDFLASDSYSACIGMGAYVRDDMDEATAYNLTKAMYEQIETYRSAHRLLKAAVTEKTLAETGPVPHHPGALRYMREKGLVQ